MKYSVVEIQRRGDGWKVSVYKEKRSRERTDTVPNPLGFLYFENDAGSALEVLKACMVGLRQAEIARLEQEIAGLSALTLPTPRTK